MALVDHLAWVELDQVHIMGRVETMQTASQKKKDVMSVGSLLLVTITTTIELRAIHFFPAHDQKNKSAITSVWRAKSI